MTLIISEPVDTREKLRAIIPPWEGNASKKDHDRLNGVAREFIAQSPYVMISSVGLVTVYDDKTLIIPDRLGNHRVDTFENLLIDPGVGLFFLIPGHSETLRIAGKGQIARDEALRKPFAIRGKLPELVLVVTVEQVFMHCSKSIVRSKLWSSDTWQAERAPSLAYWVKSTVDTQETLEQVQGNHDRDRENRLY